MKTPQQYRAEKVIEYQEIRELITEHYEAFWKVAELLYKQKESTRIETPFGDWIFQPKIGEVEDV